MNEHNLPVPDDMPWVNLSKEEIEELRKSKKELTEYGKQKLRELMTEPIHAKVSEEDYQKVLDAFNNPQPYPDEMLEEVEKASKFGQRACTPYTEEWEVEAAQKFGQLVYTEEWEQEQEQRRQRILERYNDFYNMECVGLPHGTPITPEHQQIIAFESMIDALRCEHLNDEFNVILISDIEDLIERLRNQANEFLKTFKEFKDSADGVA